VDIATGEMSQLFSADNFCYTATPPFYSQQTGKFYKPNVFDFYSIDLKNQTAENLITFGDLCYITGAVEKPIYADGVPAAPIVKAVSFANESLRGNISFTMPEATSNDDSDISYTVYLNGEVIAADQSLYGETVSVPVSVEKDGRYIFNVTATNEAGESPKSVDYVYIGVEPPKAPQSVSAVWADGKFTVSWNAVTEGQYGDAISADDVTYTVTRYPDNVVVADNIKDTSFVDEIVEPNALTLYYYTVSANYKGYSNESKSNTVPVGKIQAPYSNSFDDDDALMAYTILDANADGVTWYKNNGGIKIECNEYWSNAEVDNDDWFITPGIAMSAGKVYKISYDLSASSYYQSKYELCLGNSNTAESMTTKIVEPTLVGTDGELQSFTQYYAPESDCTAYIGWHNIATFDTGGMTIDNFSIEVYNANAPGEVDNLAIVTDAKGDSNATISFNAPSKNYLGDGDITELTKIEVLRDNVLIKTFENPQVGEALSFVDNVDELGAYTYTITPYNSNGEGHSTVKAVYIGINTPGEVTNLVATGTSSNGEVEISWNAPEVDADGYPINRSLVKYKVYRVSNDDEDNSTLIAETSNCRYIYHPIADGTQEACQYKVAAYTEAGSSDFVETNKVMIGTPHTMPYRDNFSNQGYPDNVYAIRNISGFSYWGVVSGDDDVNGDGGFIRAISWTRGGETMLYTGQITISGENPLLSFFAYYHDSASFDASKFTVCVSEDFGNTFTDVQEFVLGDYNKYVDGWNMMRCDMSAYKGKTVVVGIKATSQGVAMGLDGITLSEASDKDVMLSTLTVPATTIGDEDFDITVKVRNVGEKAINGAVVNLFRNDVVVDAKIVQLDVDEMATITFTQNNAVKAETTYKYYAIAHLNGDANTDNNKSTIAETTTLVNSAVGSLSADALSISVANHAIVIANADGKDIVVSSIDGKVIAHEVGASETHIDVAPGIYIVRVGNNTRKLAVQ
jgi:hypothetical protein